MDKTYHVRWNGAGNKSNTESADNTTNNDLLDRKRSGLDNSADDDANISEDQCKSTSHFHAKECRED